MSSDRSRQLRFLAEKLPHRDASGNKGSFGTLTVAAGARNYRGAAALAVSAALRSGVGIVRLASVEEVIAAVSGEIREAVYLPLQKTPSGSISAADFIAKSPSLTRSRAVLLGCGMTDCTDTAEIVTHMIRQERYPLVLDADALNSIKNNPSLLREAGIPPVITPHVGEMARLNGLPIPEIQADRQAAAMAFAKEYRCITVLKDAITVVASPSGEVFVCDFPNSGLAKGGSGDVLSGVIASFVCQGMDGFTAAACGVTLHSLAGAFAAEAFTEEAMLPSDLITMFPRVFDGVRKERSDL